MKGSFANRQHAGQLLAAKLQAYAGRNDVIVLGLPRGGLPVAQVVSQTLNLPLDAFLVRKLGVPGQSELAMGAIAMGNVRVLNDDVITSLGLSNSVIERAAAHEQQELERRNQLYRGGRPPPSLKDQTVILVDDGLATGATMLAAARAVKKMKPTKVIIAVPVAPPETYFRLKTEVDEMICLSMPESFYAISMWYQDFTQTSDLEVQAILKDASTQSKRS